MNTDVLVLIVPYVAGWLIYTTLLWLLIKMQKIQYNGLGLLASTAAAILAGFIPVIGNYASFPVLALCLLKSTRAKLVPDILFTVAVTGALMFCVNLWVLGMLMGKLGYPHVTPGTAIVQAKESPAETDQAQPQTEIPDAPPPEPQGPPPLVTFHKDHPAGITLKGISFSAKRPLAIIEAGKQIHTIAPGEGFSARGEEGPLRVLCENINRSSVILFLETGERVELLLD